MAASKQKVEIDELTWLIHQEVIARVGKGKTVSFAIAPDKERGWVVRTSLFGRRHHAAVKNALADVEREFQARYAIPKIGQ